ncbi:MAG: hypothetical protein OEZ10_00740 [Gammaproteobacteria bacterium]|nr:hypothetical protein [Gammaproteobacteria bacterium]
MKNCKTGLITTILASALLITGVSAVNAAGMKNIDGRKITMKVDLWQNVMNLSNKGKADFFTVYLKSGAKFTGDIDTIGKGHIHMKLKNENDGNDNGYDAIVDKDSVIAIEVQMRQYK